MTNPEATDVFLALCSIFAGAWLWGFVTGRLVEQYRAKQRLEESHASQFREREQLLESFKGLYQQKGD